MLPNWALFCIADFKHQTPAQRSADQVAIIHPSFILLAPVEIEGGLTGLMLAEGSISNSTIEVEWEGDRWQLQIPKLDGFTVAQSNVELNGTKQLSAVETSGSGSPSAPPAAGSPAPAML